MKDPVLKRTVQILMVLAGTLAGLTAFTELLPSKWIAYIGIAVAVLTTLAQQIEKRMLPRAGKAAKGMNGAGQKLALFAVLGAAACATGCGGGLSAGYRAVYITERAGEAASKGLAEAIKMRRKYCREKHTDATKYQTCLESHIKAGQRWVKYVKPAINTSLKATFAGLEQARKKGSDAKWEERIKSGFCVLVGAVKDWEHLMGDKAKEALSWVKLVEGLVCEK